ncbi:MAG: flagellar assembly peptidoglycan hydrolase FlgJ [Panacagrimonas sp.]
MSLAAPTPSATDFGSLASLKASARANDPESMRKAAQQFEALFTQQLLKSARAANLGDDIIGGGQTEFYQDLFDQQMALHLSDGKGMGLADVLVKQMMGSDAGGAMPRPAARVPTTLRLASVQSGQSPSYSPQTFIGQIKPHAERAARELGVPAEAIMAQAALETGWGAHVAKKADGSSSHNYFGIKANKSWDGARLEKTTHEHLGGRMQKVSAEFRSYESVGAAFDDYVAFLKSNPRYAEVLKQGDNAAGFAQGLQAAGYATDPAYADKLLKLVRSESISRAGTASSERSA